MFFIIGEVGKKKKKKKIVIHIHGIIMIKQILQELMEIVSAVNIYHINIYYIMTKL